MCDIKEITPIIYVDFSFIKISWPNLFKMSLYTILNSKKIKEGEKLTYGNSLFNVTSVP